MLVELGDKGFLSLPVSILVCAKDSPSSFNQCSPPGADLAWVDLEPASYLCCGLLTFECLKGYLSLKGGAVLLATLLHLLLLRAYFVILGAGTDLSYLSEILGPSHLPPDVTEDFRSTRTSHLLAISGLHVGVILALSLGAAAWLVGRRRQLYLLLPLGAIWLYALLSGMSPSVERAAIMGSVFLLALAVGRPRSILHALVLAAAVMAGLEPQVLEQVSFQLSITAVAGIALVIPSVQRTGGQIPGFFISGGDGGVVC